MVLISVYKRLDKLSTLWLARQPFSPTQLEGIHAPTHMPTMVSSLALATVTPPTHTPPLPNPRPFQPDPFLPHDQQVYQPLLHERNHMQAPLDQIIFTKYEESIVGPKDELCHSEDDNLAILHERTFSYMASIFDPSRIFIQGLLL